MATRAAYPVSEAATGGVAAGLVAGVVLALFLTAANLARGVNLWIGFKAAGAPFLAERALQPGFDALAIVVGIVSHLGVSVVWGALFGLLFYGLGRGATVVAGVVWGLVVWVMMYYALLPVLGLGAITASTPVPLAVAQHVLFGVTVALAFLAVPHGMSDGIPSHGAPRSSTPRPRATVA